MEQNGMWKVYRIVVDRVWHVACCMVHVACCMLHVAGRLGMS